MGSCKSLLCDQEVRRIRSWAIEKDIFITVAHFLDILNVDADQQKTKSELRTECTLYESIFDYIQKYLDFSPSADLFASRINVKLSRFFAN